LLSRFIMFVKLTASTNIHNEKIVGFFFYH
jgi:hypothetical protein